VKCVAAFACETRLNRLFEEFMLFTPKSYTFWCESHLQCVTFAVNRHHKTERSRCSLSSRSYLPESERLHRSSEVVPEVRSTSATSATSAPHTSQPKRAATWVAPESAGSSEPSQPDLDHRSYHIRTPCSSPPPGRPAT